MTVEEAAGCQYCPYCRQWGRFLPHGVDAPVLIEARVVGGGRRERALCPTCRSTDRERLLHAYLSAATGFRIDGWDVLHVAPERSLRWLLQRLAPRLIVTADLARRSALRLDLTRLPMRDASFDLIICCHVLEHVPDDRAAMREIARVLKPGGFAILQVPIATARDWTDEDPAVTSEEIRIARFGQSDHVRLYGRDYPARLEASGLCVEPRPCATIADAALMRRHGLDENETLYIVRPRAGAECHTLNHRRSV